MKPASGARTRTAGGLVRIRALAPAVLLLLTLAPVALANGGTLRLTNVAMGLYRVSVFTDPTPVRPDTLDVSVLVLHAEVPGVAEGVRVTVHARPLGHHGEEHLREATREEADDPRYHATKFALGAEGDWEITVAVSGPDGSGQASFRIRARERGFLGHPLVLTLLALLPLAAVALWIYRHEEGGAGLTEAARPGGGEGAPAPPG
jgi:hypothetical protein